MKLKIEENPVTEVTIYVNNLNIYLQLVHKAKLPSSKLGNESQIFEMIWEGVKRE